jgi:hypothetical protein
MKHFVCLFILLLLLFSCKKEAKIKLPPAEKKLVVTCFISPGDTIITASVRTSSPKFSGTGVGFMPVYEDVVTDATVVISDRVTSLTLPYFPEASAYGQLNKTMPIQSGKTYYLTVTTPDGKSVSATTTVPEGQLEISSFDVEIQKNDSNSMEYNTRIIAKDIPDVINYVCIVSEDFSSPLPDDPPIFIDSYPSAIRFFDSDEKIKKTNYVDSHMDSFYSPSIIRYAALNISVLNCSKEFYLYNESAEKAAFSGGNPFGEPVLVYTNISNGFGCFGSFVGNYQFKRIR